MRDTQQVVIFQAGARIPVFHAWGEYQMTKAPMSLVPGMIEVRNETRTRCGLLMYQHHWVRYSDGHDVTVHQYRADRTDMRFDNASKVGRACERCWP